MGILSNILKRSVYPVDTPCGVIHLRELTFAELAQVQEADEQHRTGLLFALSLVSPDGSALLPRSEKESVSEWADRMVSEMQDMEGSAIKAINDRMSKWYRPPSEKQAEKLAKN